MKRRLIRVCLSVVGGAWLASGVGFSVTQAGHDPFIGQLQYYPYNFAPRGWAYCNGQLLPIAQNTALFSLIGTTFGGDGRTTMGLPDMRGRMPVHPGNGPGLSPYRSGEKAGVETVTVTLAQLPHHSHTLNGTTAVGNQGSPANGILARDGRDRTYSNAVPDVSLHAQSVSSAGGGQAHDNMPPYLALNCNIALIGIYPSRS